MEKQPERYEDQDVEMVKKANTKSLGAANLLRNYNNKVEIDAYGNTGRWENARIVLKEMEANNVKQNSYVFSRILVSCSFNFTVPIDSQMQFGILCRSNSDGLGGLCVNFLILGGGPVHISKDVTWKRVKLKPTLPSFFFVDEHPKGGKP
ncbi:hypothetical protein LXL04_017144 [Taraxacum kok-saghyz]